MAEYDKKEVRDLYATMMHANRLANPKASSEEVIEQTQKDVEELRRMLREKNILQ